MDRCGEGQKEGRSKEQGKGETLSQVVHKSDSRSGLHHTYTEFWRGVIISKWIIVNCSNREGFFLSLLQQ